MISIRVLHPTLASRTGEGIARRSPHYSFDSKNKAVLLPAADPNVIAQLRQREVANGRNSQRMAIPGAERRRGREQKYGGMFERRHERRDPPIAAEEGRGTDSNPHHWSNAGRWPLVFGLEGFELGVGEVVTG